MTHVLSLIADKTKTALDGALADRISERFDAVGISPQTPVWLAEDEALQIAFAGDPGAARAHVAPVLGDRPVDFAITDLRSRRKKLLVADMDSTMIEQECIDELAAAIGAGPQVAAITDRAMRGDIDFGPALRERAALLAGLPVSTVDDVLAERITLTPGGRTLVATMAANGARTLLVSGGFTVFAEKIGRLLGVHAACANRLEIEGERFTGRVIEPILGRNAKREALTATASAHGIALSDTLAVGDGANDLAMLSTAGLGVAYHAKPSVRAAADVTINHTDLTALLFLQGYRRASFVD